MADQSSDRESNGQAWLSAAAESARTHYAARIASPDAASRWWTAVVVTAATARQAGHFNSEIQRRKTEGKLPSGVVYLAVPDCEDLRLGSGGATLNALRIFAQHTLIPERFSGTLTEWWSRQRVLMIHAGGDPRRLPQFTHSGRLFTPLPVKTPWGETSTVFDEILALSTAWAERLECGLVISPGDVLLALDSSNLDLGGPGVTGVAMRQPLELAGDHGVYALDDSGRIYSFLRKPTIAELRSNGAIIDDRWVALDTGLLAFDAPTAATLSSLSGVHREESGWRTNPGLLDRALGPTPVIDLYHHLTSALTGQWSAKPDSPPALAALAAAFAEVPFRCLVVDGRFDHVGTTTSFHRIIAERSELSDLYAVQQRLGSVAPPGVQSSGVIIDSIFTADCSLDSGAVAIECNLNVPVSAARGAILHGLAGLKSPVVVPEHVVVHQLPILLPDSSRGFVVHAYGVSDDPKLPVISKEATWFGRPVLDVVNDLGLSADEVWPGIPEGARSLWNAGLYCMGELEQAWDCACWLMGLQPIGFDRTQWRRLPKLSLAMDMQCVDANALSDARVARLGAGWQLTAVSLARAGSDIRPMLALSPGIAALAATGNTLAGDAASLEATQPTEAACRHFQASLFLGQAGLAERSETCRAEAFRCVRVAVERGVQQAGGRRFSAPGQLAHRSVRVLAPPRIDFGGGWSDTPPFCFDWGGTVLNAGLILNGQYPISASVRALDEPIVRCIADDQRIEYRSPAEVLAPPQVGCPFAIPRVALQMLGWNGAGLEIHTSVDLPMGSGLGTSSILAAAVLRALAEMFGIPPSSSELGDHVMCLEQRMTTGGGWQDQAGGTYPGLKLISSGPGLNQRLRVQPVEWSAARRADFCSRFVLYYTGIRRIAKGLLTQVVGSYLAREVAPIQVLHSIKTLAVEMAYAMREGEWAYLGHLLQRHWELNQILDPHTTNAPISNLLRDLKPYLAGAKLAGAGGGGFLMLLAKSPESALAMREHLRNSSGRLFEYEFADSGLVLEIDMPAEGS